MSETRATTEPEVTEVPPEPERARAPAPALLDVHERRAQAPTPAPPPAALARGASRRATSDVSPLRSFGIAVPFYAVSLLCASVAPAKARAILLDRGWPPHATLILTAFAFAILLTKGLGLRGQRRAFALALLPEGERRIGPEEAARVADHVEEVRGVGGPRSFLVERVLRVLSQYASRGEVAEAAAANEADADADAASVAASFSTVKVLVWAMPILGLVGTVVGLSGAVGAFSSAMSAAEQLDTIKDSLRQVTTGLAVAFDATFVALIASILVMLPMTMLQKSEDKLLNDVDDYVATHLLARLGREKSAAREEQEATPAVDAKGLRLYLLDALTKPLEVMLSAHARALERLAEERRVLSGAQDTFVAQLSVFAGAVQKAAPALERASGQLERTTAEVGPSLDRVAAELARAAPVGPSLERAIAQLDRTTREVSEGMARAVAGLERATVQVEERVAPGVERAAASMERAVTQLEVAAAVSDQAATAAERAQDQLVRELGASRQLLSLLVAGLGAADASSSKPRHANGTNGAHGTSGANGAGASREG